MNLQAIKQAAELVKKYSGPIIINDMRLRSEIYSARQLISQISACEIGKLIAVVEAATIAQRTMNEHQCGLKCLDDALEALDYE